MTWLTTFKIKDLLNLYRDQLVVGGLGLGVIGVILLGSVKPGLFLPESNVQFACPTSGEQLITGAEEHYLPANPPNKDWGRPGGCFKPSKIILHTTTGNFPTLQSVYDYFKNGASDGTTEFGTSAHFVIGTSGEIWQLLPAYEGAFERAYGIANYNLESISIEILYPGDFGSKQAVAAPQYAAVMNLTKTLTQKYGIQPSSHDCNWVANFDAASGKATSDAYDASSGAGIFGHYQLNPLSKSDPGKGMMCDFITDFKQSGSATNPNPGTGGGSGTGSGSTGVGGRVARRLTAYDAYARPYSWPMTGKVRQIYGLTPEAQNLGQRYPLLYPLGDPGIVFSKTNTTNPAPNADPAKNRFINPNIDIEPSVKDAPGRAVYATHAGWLTFADWAGPEKGYTVQVESDTDGDGQADYATRYMRLQSPRQIGGSATPYFAPDIPARPAPKDPAPVALKPVVIEGEAMSSDSGFVSAVTQPGASNGFAMGFFKGGTAKKTINERADRLTIIARGTPCLGPDGQKDPIMIVKLDDIEIQRVKVSNENWAEFTYDVFLDGAAHIFSISYENDWFIAGGCDRNLFVDSSSFVVLNPNTPITKTLSSTVVEAESLTPSNDNAPRIRPDAQASNQQMMEDKYGGSISGDITAAEGNWLIVRARGAQCGEEPPKMKVTLDGNSVTFSVPDEDWTDFSTAINLTSKADNKHQLKIEYINDTYRFLVCDRDIYYDKITLEKRETTQSPKNGTSLIGKTKYVAFNQLLGYVSESRSSDHPAGIPEDAIPNSNQTYLSYRIMYNNPNLTTYPMPNEPDTFINARVDNPYIIETPDNTVAGSLKDWYTNPTAPLYFFCAHRQRGDSVKCVYLPNPL
jgi:hypothetical protein